METQNTSYNRGPQIEKPSESPMRFSGRTFMGIVIVLVGSTILLRQLHVPLPWWVTSWQMLLIVIGLYMGVKSSFRGIGWAIPLLIGGVFLFEELFFDFPMHRLFIPALIIGIGLYMIFKPKKKDFWGPLNSNEDMLDATAVFGGVKKNIITKDFKGGEVTSIFGGSEINLAQADINGRVVLDVTTLFGGCKIIVPSHWQINSDGLTAIMGALEDKRAIMASPNVDSNKVLVIKGVVMFGGIEIKSF